MIYGYLLVEKGSQFITLFCIFSLLDAIILFTGMYKFEFKTGTLLITVPLGTEKDLPV